jgi:hypothetical protein
LSAAKITTGYLAAARLDTLVAYISNSAMIAAAVIQSAHIGNLQVKTANIDNLAITDAKISDLTVEKLTGTIITGKTIRTSSGGLRCEMSAPSHDLFLVNASTVVGNQIAQTFIGQHYDNVNCGLIKYSPYYSIPFSYANFEIYNSPIGAGSLQAALVLCDMGSTTLEAGQVWVRGSRLAPYTNNQVWLGSSSYGFKGLYLTSAGIIYNEAIAAMTFEYNSASWSNAICRLDILPNADNSGQIGYDTKRWNRVRAVNIVSGDYWFENKFRITEEGKNKLAFKNPKDETILILDSKGNLWKKGQIK